MVSGLGGFAGYVSLGNPARGGGIPTYIPPELLPREDGPADPRQDRVRGLIKRRSSEVVEVAGCAAHHVAHGHHATLVRAGQLWS